MRLIEEPFVKRIPFLSTICVDCGRPGLVTQLGAPCIWCETGIYLRQGLFDFGLCSSCCGRNPFCKDCFGRGLIPVPREDLTKEHVDAELRSMVESQNRPWTPVLPPQEIKYEWKAKRRKRRR